MVVTHAKVSGKLLFQLNTVISVFTWKPQCLSCPFCLNVQCHPLYNLFIQQLFHSFYTWLNLINKVTPMEASKLLSHPMYIPLNGHVSHWEPISCWLKRFIRPQVPMIMKLPWRHEYASFIPSMYAVLCYRGSTHRVLSVFWQVLRHVLG